MADIKKLLDKIIPYPADYFHRNGFSNNNLIDDLNPADKILIEVALIDKLAEHPEDLLIVETLAYMKSNKSLYVLHNLLKNITRPQDKIIIASSIFAISQDSNMCDIVFEASKKITDKYSLISMFYYMAKMRDKRINDYIRQYYNSEDYLLSYNAKRSVGLYE